MTEKTLLNAKGWSATAVRTSLVLVLVALLLITIGAMAQQPGLLVLAMIVGGAGVLAGIIGAVGSMLRR